MSKRVDKLAGELVTKMLADAGIAKSTGSTAQYMPYAVGLAESIVMVEKTLKRSVRQMERHSEEIGRLVDANAERIRYLAERWTEYSGQAVPGVTQIHQRVVDMDLERFRVGLVEHQAPKKMNGNSSHGEGVDSQPAPLWHPESDN